MLVFSADNLAIVPVSAGDVEGYYIKRTAGEVEQSTLGMQSGVPQLVKLLAKNNFKYHEIYILQVNASQGSIFKIEGKAIKHNLHRVKLYTLGNDTEKYYLSASLSQLAFVASQDVQSLELEKFRFTIVPLEVSV